MTEKAQLLVIANWLAECSVEGDDPSNTLVSNRIGLCKSKLAPQFGYGKLWGASATRQVFSSQLHELVVWILTVYVFTYTNVNSRLLVSKSSC